MFSMLGNLIFGAQDEEELQTQEQIVTVQATDACTQTAQQATSIHQNNNEINPRANVANGGPKCNDWILINRSEKSNQNVNDKSLFDVGVNTSVMMLNSQYHVNNEQKPRQHQQTSTTTSTISPIDNQISTEAVATTCQYGPQNKPTATKALTYANITKLNTSKYNEDQDEEMEEAEQQFEDKEEEQEEVVYATCATREEAAALLYASTNSDCLLDAFFERANEEEADVDDQEMLSQEELERRELTCLTLLNSNKKEDWLITPLPCLTSITTSQRSIIENHPLENLLIEHPSMSVFVSATSSSCEEDEDFSDSEEEYQRKRQVKKSNNSNNYNNNKNTNCKIVAIPATKTIAIIPQQQKQQKKHQQIPMKKQPQQQQPKKEEESLAKHATSTSTTTKSLPTPAVKPLASRQMIKKAVAEKRQCAELTASTVGKVLAGIQQSTLPRSAIVKKNTKKVKKSSSFNSTNKSLTASSDDEKDKENSNALLQSQIQSSSSTTNISDRLNRKADSQSLKSKKKSQMKRVNKINTFSSVKNVSNKQQRKCHKLQQPAFTMAAGSF